MKRLSMLLGLLLIAGVAMAGDQPADPVTPLGRVSCDLQSVVYDWDFGVSDQGWTTTTCDATGGNPAWEWGTTTFVPGAPGTVWGTVLEANYLNDTGDGLLSPPFMVTDDAYLMEILHYVHMESNYDGGNVKVDGVVIEPTNGYHIPAISTSTSYYAFCVDAQPGYTGNGSSGASEVWMEQCFDLSPFIGSEIQVEFDFGSDSSVAYPGWYLAYVKVGAPDVIPVSESSWGAVKSLYR